MLIFSSWVWFGLFVHPFSHACNIGHVNYILLFIYYNTTYNIWESTQYNIINNNTKFKVEVQSGTTVGTAAYCLVAISRTKSDHVLYFNSRRDVSVNSHEFTLCCLLPICSCYPFMEHTTIWRWLLVLRCQFVVEVGIMY